MGPRNEPIYRDAFGAKHNSLFRPGSNMQLNACVGRNGGMAGFDRYARGYFEAGARLVKSLREDCLGVDCVVYPLVMVYRHGVETALKYLGQVLPRLCEEAIDVKWNHNLLANWKRVRRCMERLEEETEAFDQIENLLKDLVQIDPNSTVFRYPVANDKEKTPHLQDTSLINVKVFGDEMELLSQFLESWCGWADHLYELECEAACERMVDEEWEYVGDLDDCVW